MQYFRYFCNMIEIAQHIEVLLLENDCVIVPGLGGFVAHYTSSTRIEEENLFLPPTRVIGFNPQLKMNDGLFVQSYMDVYDTSFSDATKIVEKEVKKLITILHEEGKADFPNIGELRYSVHNTYEFRPYNNKITTPYLYGLDSFEIQELAALKKNTDYKHISSDKAEKKQEFKLKIKASYLSNAVAMIAIVALFFLLSTPIENTEVLEANYAQLLPAELFEKIEKQSLVITPIIIRQSAKPSVTAKSVPLNKANLSLTMPAKKQKEQAMTTVSVSTPTAEKREKLEYNEPSKPYHIIIASVGSKEDAAILAKQLINNGYSDATTIIGDGKMRVSIESCSTIKEAYQSLNKIRQEEAYSTAWILKKK